MDLAARPSDPLGVRPWLLLSALCPLALPQDGRERWVGPPIHYEETPREGPVERLLARLDAGEVTLAHDPRRGYLPALLAALDVPASSQTLVFSKTSFQLARISPDHPRALYFGDDVYVGWVPGAPVLEITSVDPRLGPVFYVLSQSAATPPRPERKQGECLQCHGTPMTGDWPGHVVRSVHTDDTGTPNFAAGTALVDDSTPFDRRWGGWYVTGETGDLRHLGNALLGEGETALEPRATAPDFDLARAVDGELYLGAHSDVVALLVLEHQAKMHNVLARAAYEVRLALAREELYDELLGDASAQGPRELRESTQRVLARQAEHVVDGLLFAREEPLPNPVRGRADFARDFEALGPRDAAGRSLRDLDLETRLLRRPCSWLVYSPAFDALPEPLLDAVARRLDRVLRGAPAYDEYVRLTLPMRREIRAVLLATHPGLAARWRP